ncbi:unnamed protein product [Soboliphyme baturini]|uniref:Methyltransferase n=1 Tax=Soboliphyme baturini TaxID=241478 RepID=A0A183JB67_9BILA|nr:unnamed protein product [Soboliphyme baturini]
MLKNMVSLIKSDGYVIFGGYATVSASADLVAKSREIRGSINNSDVDVIEWYDCTLPISDNKEVFILALKKV